MAKPTLLRYAQSLVLIFVLSASLTTTSLATEKQVLVGGFVDFPPLTYADRDGQPAGITIDYINALAEQAGFIIHWQELPVARVHHFLRSGEVDLWPGLSNLAILQDHKVEADLALPPITLRAYHLPHMPSVENASQLQGQRLILLQNYTYHGVLDPALANPNTIRLVAPNHLSALRMLQKGRGHYLIDYDAPLEVVLTMVGMRDIHSSMLAEHQVALIVSRRANDPLGIVDALERAEQALNENYKQE